METLSINKFKQNGFCSYGDELLITNNIENVEQFRFPCRIDAITFLICIRGEVDCHVNLKEYKVKENGILVNFPESIIQLDSTSDFEGYAILISNDYLERLHIDIKKKIDVYINLKNHPLTYAQTSDILCLRYYYFLIKESLSSINDDMDEIIRGILLSFVFKIISIINSRHESNINECMDKPNIQKYFEDFMSLLSAHHSSERSIGFYADKMNITSNYLSCIVKEYSNYPASHWIGKYVILEAEVMLKMAGMNVQQVAYKLNFPSQSMFGKYFKKHTGITPKDYIRGRQKQNEENLSLNTGKYLQQIADEETEQRH